ncbi:MAG: cytochrome P450 [Hyphomonadaceae bacterium]
MDGARCPRTGVPDHVPDDLVREFSIYKSPGLTPTPHGDPHAALGYLREYPPIFYSPSNAYDGSGSWVVRRAEDQRSIMGDPATFSSKRKWLFDEALGPDFILRPLENDPPLHTDYRMLLNPLLSPKRVDAMEADVRRRAIELIDGFKPRRECDVMKDFAFPFAVGVFLQFMGIGDERRDEFIGWVEDLFHKTVDDRRMAVKRVTDFMKELMELRRREPTDDFMSFLLASRVNGRALEEIEIVGLGTLLFNGGLDTVATHIGLNLYHFARYPEHQAWLRANPDGTKTAVEELLRAYSTITPLRQVTKDTEINGVQLKPGDVVSCPSMLANRDATEFPNPDDIDLTRENNRHTAFAYGPHRCLGSHLARREIIIGMEEFFARIPTFAIKPGSTPITHGGYVFGVDDLVLSWN